MRTRWTDLNYNDDEDDVGYAEDDYHHEDNVDHGSLLHFLNNKTQ